MRNLLGLQISLVLLAIAPCACRSLVPVRQAATLADAEAPEASLAAGRYLGFAKPDMVESRLTAALDLVGLGDSQGVSHYRAVLRLSSGGQADAAYGSVYFSDVTYNRDSRVLAFGGAPTGIALTKMRTAGGSISGTLMSQLDQASVEFVVTLVGLPGPSVAFHPALPLMPPPSASYSGSCPDHVSGLQIEAGRWPEDSGGLFGSVRLTGRLLQADPSRCSDNQPCLKQTYSSGRYHPLSGSLELGTGANKLVCKIMQDQLTCGNCSLSFDPISPYANLTQRVGDEVFHDRTQHLLASPSLPVLAPYSGSSYGYLHHERTNTYQLIALNFQVEHPLQAATATPASGGAQLLSVASAYFGEGNSSELIAYRLGPIAWNGQLPLVLDGSGEVFVVVEAWDDARMLGTWYSKTLGRIGSVELQPKVVPALTKGLRSMRKLSGSYQGGNWDLSIAATANLSEHSGDFYPLKINGWARDKADEARRRTIKDGAYDFYTGRLALRLDDGRMAIGRIDAEGLQVYWPAKPRLGASLPVGIQLLKPTAGSL